MTRQEVLAQIAYSFFQRHRALGDEDDPARDWTSAERVFDHYVEPAQFDSWVWRVNNADYEQYADVMQKYIDSNPLPTD